MKSITAFVLALMFSGMASATSFWPDEPIKEDPMVSYGNIWDDRCDCKEK